MSRRSQLEPVVAKLQASDLDEMREALVGWDHEYKQIGKGSINLNRLFSQVGTTQIFREQWSCRLHYRGTSPASTFGMAVTLNQKDDARWMGAAAGNNDVIIQKSEEEADYLSSSEWDALVLAIPQQEFMQLARDFAGGDPVDPSDFHGVAHFTPEVCSRVRRLGLAYCSTMERSVQHPGMSAQLSQMARSLVSMMVSELVNSRLSRFEKPALPRKRMLVRQAEDYVTSRAEQPVRVENICHAVGVSERMLYYAFTDAVGMTPTHWLRIQRLNNVHRVLNRADPEETLVKQIALENGFLHLGHFSANYKQLFGEAPSETLRR